MYNVAPSSNWVQSVCPESAPQSQSLQSPWLPSSQLPCGVLPAQGAPGPPASSAAARTPPAAISYLTASSQALLPAGPASPLLLLTHLPVPMPGAALWA